MKQRRNTLKATSEELECIKAAAKKRGWTTTPDSRAPIETSQELIEKKLQSCPKLDENYCIPLEVLENWIDEEEINVKDKKIYRKFTDEIENRKDGKVNSLDLDKLVFDGVILASGVSLPTYCKFVRGENRINSNAFIAFWEALGFDRRDISELQAKAKITGNQKPDRLYKALLSFDYRDPCHKIKNIACESSRTSAFWIPYSNHLGCQYSQVWLTKRIETEFYKYASNTWETRKINFDLFSEFETFNISKFWMSIGDKLNGMDLDGALKQNNIILWMKNIDRCDRSRVNEILNKFWNPLVEQVSHRPGFLLLFLVDGGQKNDWRQEWEEEKIGNRVIKVSAIPSFSHVNLRDDIDDICGILQQRLDGSVDDFIHEILNYQREGKTDLILQTIYKKFNCRFSADKWQKYL